MASIRFGDDDMIVKGRRKQSTAQTAPQLPVWASVFPKSSRGSARFADAARLRGCDNFLLHTNNSGNIHHFHVRGPPPIWYGSTGNREGLNFGHGHRPLTMFTSKPSPRP